MASFYTNKGTKKGFNTNNIEYKKPFVKSKKSMNISMAEAMPAKPGAVTFIGSTAVTEYCDRC